MCAVLRLEFLLCHRTVLCVFMKGHKSLKTVTFGGEMGGIKKQGDQLMVDRRDSDVMKKQKSRGGVGETVTSLKMARRLKRPLPPRDSR